ncbi:MAG: Bro-N domain-containing protein [Iphinoe sp. HA4291-MV1]|nr:Bro-N domain-containing protein [Iphinoe sp. HA4291-MV1]
MSDIVKLEYLNVEHTFMFLDSLHWTLAEPVVKFLGFGSNTSRALKRHCREHHYRQIRIEGTEGRSPLYVSLAGLIRLTIRSDHEKAQDFQDWITDEVVPMVLTQGLYADKSRFSDEEYQKLMDVVAERDARIAQLESENGEVRQCVTDFCNRMSFKDWQKFLQNKGFYISEPRIRQIKRALQVAGNGMFPDDDDPHTFKNLYLATLQTLNSRDDYGHEHRKFQDMFQAIAQVPRQEYKGVRYSD